LLVGVLKCGFQSLQEASVGESLSRAWLCGIAERSAAMSIPPTSSTCLETFIIDRTSTKCSDSLRLDLACWTWSFEFLIRARGNTSEIVFALEEDEYR
jgi:hypothetical protein